MSEQYDEYILKQFGRVMFVKETNVEQITGETTTYTDNIRKAKRFNSLSEANKVIGELYKVNNLLFQIEEG